MKLDKYCCGFPYAYTYIYTYILYIWGPIYSDNGKIKIIHTTDHDRLIANLTVEIIICLHFNTVELLGIKVQASPY